jgi:hypothetical protein
MANERSWRQISAVFTANGTIDGIVTVASTRGFKVKARVQLQSTAQAQSEYEIKAIPNSTTIIVGPIGQSIDVYSNVSAFLLADNSSIVQYKQKRPPIGPGEIDRATYEEEPTVARRTVLVDEFGDKYATDNPVPVQLTDGSINIGTVNAELEVQLSHLDNSPDPGDVHDSVRIGGDTYEASVDSRQRLFVIDEDARLVQRLSLATQNANFLKLSNYDNVSPVFRTGGADLEYYEDGALVGKAAIDYDESQDWSVVLAAYINDTNGSLLQDDDDEFLNLD